MNLRQGILDSVVDDGESMGQIKEYLNYLNIEFSDQSLLKEIQYLFDNNMIFVEYPKDISILNNSEINNYWFKITESGYSEWIKI